MMVRRITALFAAAILLFACYELSAGAGNISIFIEENRLRGLPPELIERSRNVINSTGLGFPAGGIYLMESRAYHGAYLPARDMVLISDSTLGDLRLFDYVLIHELCHRHDTPFRLTGMVAGMTMAFAYLYMLVSIIVLLEVRRPKRVSFVIFSYLVAYLCAFGIVMVLGVRSGSAMSELVPEIYCDLVAYKYTGYIHSHLIAQSTALIFNALVFLVAFWAFRWIKRWLSDAKGKALR